MGFWELMAQTPYWRGKGRIALAVLRHSKCPVKVYTPSGGRMWLDTDNAGMLLLPYLIGKYEPEVRRVIAAEYPRLRETKRYFVDVGANVGFYTIDALAAGVDVMAFEPNKTAYDLLNLNADITDGTLGMYPFAVSNSICYTSLYTDGRMITSGSLARMGNGVVATTVFTTTIDRMMGNAPVGLIKADIEGGELGALKGAEAVIRRDHPVIVYEDNPRFCRAFGHEVGDVQRYLEGLGYTVSTINADGETRNMRAVSLS